MRVLYRTAIVLLLAGLLSGLTACQKADPATQTLGGVVDR